jgi:hypothetical protein
MLTTRVADVVSNIIPSPQGGGACTTIGTRQCTDGARIGRTFAALFPIGRVLGSGSGSGGGILRCRIILDCLIGEVILSGGTSSLEGVVEGRAAVTGICTASSVASAVTGTCADVWFGRWGSGGGGDDLGGHRFHRDRRIRGGFRGGRRNGRGTRWTCPLVEGDVKS